MRMVRWMCGVKLKDRLPSKELRERLGVDDIASSPPVRQLICIEPTGLRLRHMGKTDPQCVTVQFCFHSGRLTCSARTGFRAVTMPLISAHR